MAVRIVNYILLFLAGALIGTVGTVAQQATVTVAGVPLPWGLVVGLVAYTCLLVGLRLLSPGRGPAVVAALGTVVVVVIFTIPSSGGSVLIPDNLAGEFWVVAPIVIAAIVVAWPRLPQRRGAEQNGIS